MANVQWEFKLSPMIQATGTRHHHGQSSSSEAELSDNDAEGNASLFPRGLSQLISSPKAKRTRKFLEDSDEEGEEGNGEGSSNSQGTQQGVTGSHGGNSNNSSGLSKADGMSMMFDHLILPLISLTNAYRKQVRGLEVVIKSKENEVVEALEMLEQSGVGYHNRRKATERYDKLRSETRLQENIEQLIRPQMFGPKELFSDKLVPVLCSIVSKNAAGQGTRQPTISLLNFDV